MIKLSIKTSRLIEVHIVNFVGFIFSRWVMKQSCTLMMIKMLHVTITEMKSKGSDQCPKIRYLVACTFL